jgi:eukaryotic-like serine/threonine-protein kinase
MRLTALARPTYYGTFLGYVGPAEVFLDLWETGQPVRDVEARAADALSRLKQFAGVFPIGRPRSATLEGRRHWQLGRRDAALRSWQQAIGHAEGLSMAYEQGIAHYEIGRHLDLGDGTRGAHLEQAREIFRRLEASPALAAVEAVSTRSVGPS